MENEYICTAKTQFRITFVTWKSTEHNGMTIGSQATT